MVVREWMSKQKHISSNRFSQPKRKAPALAWLQATESSGKAEAPFRLKAKSARAQLCGFSFPRSQRRIAPTESEMDACRPEPNRSSFSRQISVSDTCVFGCSAVLDTM